MEGQQIWSALLRADERPWVAYAACRGADADLFFPATDSNPAEALKLCRACPVQDECLEYALTARERYGVWGGTTARERRRLLRRIA